MIWAVLAGLLAITLIFLAIYYFWGWTAFTIATAFIVASLILELMRRFAYVHLNEMEIGVIFNRNGNFVRFLPSGNHTINPFYEYLSDKMSKGSQTARGTTPRIRTKEGIPVAITWAVSFRIEYPRIKEGIEHKMARSLPKNAVNMVGGKALHAIRHSIEQKSITELHSADALKKLEAELCEDVYKRSQVFGLVPIPPHDVKIGPIEMPPQVEKAIESAYERQVTIEGLERLRVVLEKFGEEHMEKLAEFERFRLLEHGDTQFYMMETIAEGKPPRARRKGMAERPPGSNGRPEPPDPSPPTP